MCPICPGAMPAPACSKPTAFAASANGNTNHHSSPNGGSPNGSDTRRRHTSTNSTTTTATTTTSSSSNRDEWQSYHEIPDYLKDNDFVIGGYRVNLGWSGSFWSLFRLHNESMNVWTHLCGFVVVTALLISTVVTLSPYGLDRVQIVPASTDTHVATHAPVAAPVAASAAGERTVWDSVLSSPELLSDAVSRLQRGEVLSDIAHVTERFRSKSATLGASAGVSDRFSAFVSEFESRLGRLQSILSGPDPIPAFRDYIRHQNELAVEEFTQFYTNSRLDMIAYAQYLIDQFKHRGGTALKLLIPTSAPATTTTLFSASPTAAASTTTTINSTSTSTTAAAAATPTPTPPVRLVAHLPIWPISIFMLSAMCCLGFSTIYHLFSSHSELIALAFQRLDYAGICLLIAGSNVPVLYYGFECETRVYRYLYLSICTALGIACFVITTTERYLAPRYRVLRTAAFVAMGVSGVIPAIHLLIVGVTHVVFDLITMGACYLCGATIYLLRVPERFHPGKFDIFFTSHQLWHCFVAAAILLHYTAVLRFFQWRQLNACPLTL